MSIFDRQVPELIELGNELLAMYKAIGEKKKAAIDKYWPLAGKKVRRKTDVKEYYAKPHDIFNAQYISASVNYSLHKTPQMQRTVEIVHESEIEEVI